MLSFCIPTFNYNVKKLVADLSRQCVALSIDFEILVLEDGLSDSGTEKNSDIESVFGVRHLIATENAGRSVTRNRLADTAKYGKLVFIDCDSELPDDLFVKRYLDNYDFEVVCGGTTYTEMQYSPEISLRYTFGNRVEKSPASKRNEAPYSAFTTNNLMVSKEVFKKVRFNENLKKYGQEDSLFGYELMQNNIRVGHIDNPVIHTGIESNEIFLEKTKMGIDNLVVINNLNDVSPDFINHIRVCAHYLRIKKFGMLWVVRLFYALFGSCLENHLLTARHPNIFLFNIYKLGYYSKKMKRVRL